MCFACGRPGSRDGSTRNWRHVGSGEVWAQLGEWAATAVGDAWVHERDLLQDPLQAGECICCRPDCVGNLFEMFKLRLKKQARGSLGAMVVGQSSPMGRYPSTGGQVIILCISISNVYYYCTSVL